MDMVFILLVIFILGWEISKRRKEKAEAEAKAIELEKKKLEVLVRVFGFLTGYPCFVLLYTFLDLLEGDMGKKFPLLNSKGIFKQEFYYLHSKVGFSNDIVGADLISREDMTEWIEAILDAIVFKSMNGKRVIRVNNNSEIILYRVLKLIAPGRDPFIMPMHYYHDCYKRCREALDARVKKPEKSGAKVTNNAFGLHPGMSKSDILLARREFAKKHHPDMVPVT